MITVTEAAKERFRAIMPAVGSGSEVLRLDTLKDTANGRAPKLGVCLADEPEEDDYPVEHKGEPLLWVSISVSADFDGCVVDVVETPRGIGFAIGPPEAGREGRSQ